MYAIEIWDGQAWAKLVERFPTATVAHDWLFARRMGTSARVVRCTKGATTDAPAAVSALQ